MRTWNIILGVNLIAACTIFTENSAVPAEPQPCYRQTALLRPADNRIEIEL